MTGNSHTNSYQGYWRGYGKGFSDDKARFGGVNQTSIFRTRLRTTRHWTTVHNGTHAGLKIGVKWRNNSGNPYGVDDWRSVLGGNPNVPSPGSCIFVCGMGPEGRFEVARNPIGNAPYMSFPSARYKAYSAGTWQYVTIRYDQIGDTQLRVRMWRNSDSTHSMTGTPDYDFTGTSPGPNSQQVFLWYRVDFVDPEWDYFTIEQKPY